MDHASIRQQEARLIEELVEHIFMTESRLTELGEVVQFLETVYCHRQSQLHARRDSQSADRGRC